MIDDEEWRKQLCGEEAEAIERLYATCYRTIYAYLCTEWSELLEHTPDYAQIAVDVVITELQNLSAPTPPNKRPAQPIANVAELAEGCSLGECKMSLIRYRDGAILDEVYGLALTISYYLKNRDHRPSDEYLDNAQDTVEQMMISAENRVRVRRTIERLIRTVAVRKHIDRLRREKNLPTGYIPDDMELSDEGYAITYETQTMAEIRERFDACIKKLPDRDKLLAELELFTELKSRQIAAEITARLKQDMTEGNVNTRWHRLRLKLRECMAESGVRFDELHVAWIILPARGETV